MNASFSRETVTLIVSHSDPDAVYPLDATAEMSGVSRRMILHYCHHGLISPASNPEQEGWHFKEEAVGTLRRIESLRNFCGANMAGLKLIMELLDEVERLRADLRFRR